ncbi:4-carboxymuconolactone decarboxylase domain/alkylhydroperoxidase AhpD family core domain protein [Pseudomonas chlororaphis subsp. aurantiaca]|uniref:carboxymuconolactone decarboxylase family protein n=1 Tax=Pseudomonas chlororaphis TaxID=587753 RepID=UPI000F553DF4|nr:carboxymuconolactone decarboxylase family protein [Pseudomonas chlororaphis]AZD35647.1 4-carboxymuconolactone decarboxylase domain/alkylhydroperoxidase AhpD family core domain protein [Pseudomonas chlororaphis subsp. aurantiaca]AZD41981.1 4-carboxymuconolactone decarboxylase domain/alkylhydroperoxidase AhpD family core domain protein [Pseudomonas chlororaphis subsp. aurantiaca]AZD48201.1 4-carboxymuconolactone decarboxylase domain/alkylhydroperoxidase AhpD family core domain protein [Pseudomo
MEPRLDYYSASPEALKGLLMLEAETFGLSIDKPLLELIKIRVSQLNHCAFCTDMHAVQARQNGESERRLYALSVWRDSGLFSPRERSALAWSESVTLLADAAVPDELFQAVRGEFSERELVDLTVAVAAINCWNRLAVAFRQQPSV